MTQSIESLHEQLLVLRFKAGDDRAFEELVDRFTPRLRYYISKLLGDTHAADDVLQEVWTVAFQGLPRLRNTRMSSPWLYRTARYCALQQLRRSGRMLTAHVDVKEIEQQAVEGTFEAADAARVHEAFDELAPPHREVLVLRFLEGMSYAQIALIVGCTIGTVRSRIHYARHALKKALERTING